MTAVDEHEVWQPTGNYALAVSAYGAAGWPGILPLPPRSKMPPPTGYTGGEGRWPSSADQLDWTLNYPDDCNVALRLPEYVIGLDIDQYGNKRGYDHLLDAMAAHNLPPPPPTWRSSARASPSGILFYRVPAGLRFRGEAVPDVEIIQFHHRFAITWPSVHPTEGPYLWYGSQVGEPLQMRVPSVTDLGLLQRPWVEFLRDDRPAPLVALSEPPEAHREALRAPAVVQALDDAVKRLESAYPGSRHAIVRDAVMRLCRLEQGGAAGSTSAIDALGYVFVDIVQGDRGLEEANAEWRRIVEGGRRLAMSTTTVAARILETERADFEALAPGAGLVDTGASAGEIVDPCAVARVDWPRFWAQERAEADYLAEPLLARGRSHAIFAAPKVGKSLLMLEVAAAIATGRPALDKRTTEPLDVAYFDMEMTEDDVYERLSDLGYGAADDLSRFHYYLLPSLPPLDTAEGGAIVEQIALARKPALVVFDTTSRVIAGPENEADTFRAFYRNTGSRLKRLGITYARLDHSGKDPTKGQRGSSAKADDVDVVWQVSIAQDGLKLKATHRRVSWVPETVDLRRQVAPLRHLIARGSYKAGTKELARRLDELAVPLDASIRAAGAAIREAGGRVDNNVLPDAVKWRRQEVERREGLI